MIPSLKQKAKGPENQWLEDEISFWGPGLFSGANLLLVSRRLIEHTFLPQLPCDFEDFGAL